ncbi:aspartate aminotransferase family protein [Paenibacillus senegalensis]|uniref:aspartate aminotransferase family protein n=1 Tax=Paenibacillus senegalensis TaxID=1465766 RepID=UPI000287D6A3|nr:aspartate aminotransferase family protein [Paenibacillus senegalensis]
MLKITKSQQLLAESKQYLAGGVASSLRASMLPVPLYVEEARGARVKDVDGNEYIDYLLAYGPLILGHANPALNEAIAKAIDKGATYGLQHEGEIKLAKKLVELLPAADQVALSGSGTEAVMLALRLAKQFTGRRKVIRFEGHFHGWSDSIFTAFPTPDMGSQTAQQNSEAVAPGTGGQSSKALEDIVLVPWNDVQKLEQAFEQHKGEIAAVISEPVMCNNGCILPKEGYLERLRELTAQEGTVLILDEVITGFRLGPGGAQERFGVIADLTTVGKALGGGSAISAVGGKAELMNQIESGAINHLGTLNGNGLAVYSALAVIEELTKDNGAAFARMEKLATELVEGIRKALQKHEIPGLLNQIGPVFHFMFTEAKEVRDFAVFQERDARKYSEFAALLLEEGVLVRPSGLWYISAVHSEKEVQDTLAAIERALARIKTVSGGKVQA